MCVLAYSCLVICHANSVFSSPFVYCHQLPVWFYHIFPHYLIKHTNLGEKVSEHKMCVLIFFVILSETFLNLSRIMPRYCYKLALTFI